MTNIENELKNNRPDYPDDSRYYILPPAPDTRRMNIDTIWDAIRTIEDLERVYERFVEDVRKGNFIVERLYATEETAIGVLRYLGKEYINSYLESVVVTHKDKYFERYMDKFEQPLIRRLSRYIGSSKEEVKDDCGGLNDIAHLAFSTLAKLVVTFSSNHWTSWGGDLATGMGDLKYYCDKYPSLNTQALSDSIIGGYPGERNRFLRNNRVEFNRVRCNFVDLCDDADSIKLSRKIYMDRRNPYILSSSMRRYYSGLDMRYRFIQYKYDGFPIDSYREMKEFLYDNVWHSRLLNRFKDGASDYQQECACDSLASFIYEMCKL